MELQLSCLGLVSQDISSVENGKGGKTYTGDRRQLFYLGAGTQDYHG
jgi:hypothetical protein